MKSKIIIFLVLLSLILPSASRAAIMLPTAKVTVVINTQGQDGFLVRIIGVSKLF